MRILADENIPREAVLALRADGHDVFSASELSAGAQDQAHVARAIAEDRVIITFDLDFGQIAATADPKPGAGVVLLRLVPQNPQEVTTILQTLFARSDLRWRGHLSIVERGHFRQRPL
jgi:predicted nuclease of predicted toxin-antitoxin system